MFRSLTKITAPTPREAVAADQFGFRMTAPSPILIVAASAR
jgi:hypothetical protein